MAFATPTTVNTKYTVFEDSKYGNIEKITVQNAKKALVGPYSNLEGRPNANNPMGAQSLCLAIPRELADRLTSEGWSVGAFEDRDTGDIIPFLNIKIEWHPMKEKYQAHMYSIAFNAKGQKIQTELDEATSKVTAENFKDIDMRIIRHPYTDKQTGEWKANGRLVMCWMTVDQDDLEEKWNGFDDGDADFNRGEEEAIPFN